MSNYMFFNYKKNLIIMSELPVTKFLMIVLLLSFMLFSMSVNAAGAFNSTPFGCTTDSYLFMSSGNSSTPTSAVSIDMTTGVATNLNSGNSFHPTNINAIGYNVTDGYIWGYDRPNDEVVRVGSNFVVDSHSIAGLPANHYHTGDVSPNGVLFLAEQWIDSGKIYKVDVNPASATYLNYLGAITLSPGIYSNFFNDKSIADFAFHPLDGNLYAVGTDDKLYKIDASTGLVTDLGDVGFSLTTNSNSAWFDKDGYFYFNGSSTSVYQIDITNPASPNSTAVLFSTLSINSEGDAARCPQAAIKSCFSPILVDDDDNHRIWKITGANRLSDLTGQNLNDGVGPDLVQVGNYTDGGFGLGYNIQDLAYDNSETIWALASGTGDGVSTLNHAYIGQLTESAGVYSFTNITDLGLTYNGTSNNKGKALIWDPQNQYFIYDANNAHLDTYTRLKAYDPVTQTVVADPWGTGSSELHISVSEASYHNYMQGLAFAHDGTLYGAVGFNPSVLIEIERNAQHKLTGNYTVITLDQAFNNIEVLETMPDGQLLIVESNGGLVGYKGKVMSVDVSTGVTTEVADLDLNFNGIPRRDWEGIKFCNAPYEPKAGISGVVFQDNNINDIYDTGEPRLINIAVSLYNDVNNDGSIDVADTLVGSTNSDANGDYTFGNLADGSYLLQVDDNDADLPANIMLGGINPLAVVVNGSIITGQDFPFDPSACSGLSGEVSEVAAGVSTQLASGDQVFVASSSPAPGKQGHFRAYKVLSNGAVKIAPEWDADNKMPIADRQSQLYSTDNSGSMILFNSLDNDAFSRSGADPIVDKIKEYSLNPSIDAGTYLAGRASGSFLGTLSRGNDVALLENRIDTWSYLDDPDYRPFALTISTRSQKALITSDDGFVYAFNQSGGDLAWGWMPRQLVQELKNYGSFQSHRYMSGKLDTLEFKDSISYGTYVVGSYKNGLGQYTLKLDTTDNDSLQSVVWDQDYSQSAFDEAPNHGERDYFRDGNGDTYTTYIVSKSNLSTLVIKKLGDNTAATEIALNFHVTSTPFVMPDFSDSQAPASKTIYLGTANGKIKRAALLDGASLETVANIKTALEGAAVGILGDNDESITFLGAASAELGNDYYMRMQSEERLTVLKYNSGTTDWDHIWTSYVTGAGAWDSSDVYTADNSGIPTDNDGDHFFTNVSDNGIQSIPTDARITDAAQIVAGTVILPVNVPSANSCSGKAYYYLYKLNAGVFPDAKFTALDHSSIIGNIALGYGDPKRVQTADIASTNQSIGYGNTDQKQNNTTGVTASFIIHDSIATGIRGWKEKTQ